MLLMPSLFTITAMFFNLHMYKLQTTPVELTCVHNVNVPVEVLPLFTKESRDTEGSAASSELSLQTHIGLHMSDVSNAWYYHQMYEALHQQTIVKSNFSVCSVLPPVVR